MSLAPKNRANWPIFSPCVTQDDWMFGEVVEIEPRDGLRLQILERTGRRNVGHVGMVGLKRPADEGREAAGLVLQLPQSLEMLDPLGQRLDVAEHHRRRAAAAQLVPDAVDVQPVVGHHLAARDLAADAIDQDLRPAAGQAPQPGRFEPLEHRSQRQLRDLGEMMNLRRAEAVNVDLRKVRA